MKKENKKLELLYKHIQTYNIDGLLPQNLSEDLLKIMSDEYGSFQKDTKDRLGISTLLTTVLCLMHKKSVVLGEDDNLKTSYENLMENINCYGACILFEEIRLSGLIKISEENLPALNNIFDENREMKIDGNYKEIEDFLAQF